MIMSELDKVLDVIMRDKSEIIIKEAPAEDKEEFTALLRENKKKKIIEEIKEAYKQELIREADIEIKKELNRQKIKELKSLMWSGFLLAFIVGLAVNQATDIIGYFKGPVSDDDIWITIVITAMLCMICLGAYVYSFLKNVIDLFDDIKKEKAEDISKGI